MAASSLPFGNPKEREFSPSFLGPLFQDHQDWPRSRRRSIPPRIFSSNFSFLDESNTYDDDEDEEETLEYLPGSNDFTPKTRQLLKRVTSQYVTGGESSSAITIDDVLEVIGEEYKSRDVPMSVGDFTFDFSSSLDVDDADAARILSFAAYHRLPRDITLLLFGPSEKYDQDSVMRCCRKAFAKGGWESVEFPNGLAIQPRRKFAKSAKEKYMPMPRSWLTSRQDAARKAQVAVNEAAAVEPPPRLLMSREELLSAMDEELSATAPSELLPTLFRDARLFFPRQNQKLKAFRKVAKRQSVLLKHAGFAGIVSYVALNFCWYTFAIVCQWRHTSATVEISSRALGSALRRFGKVLAAAYIGSQLTKFLRLKIALALAPFGHRAIRVTQKRLKISEPKAFALLTGVLIGSCLGLWSVIVLGDAAFLHSLVVSLQ